MVIASGLGMVLSLVFGCLLLALIAELCYLLWWKKLRINGTNHSEELNKRPQQASVLSHPGALTTTATTAADPVDVEMGASKDLLVRAIGGDQDAVVEAELMRLQNRLLFTIKEETKEDLESEDAKSKASRKGSRARSLSDLILSPVFSPTLKPTAQTSTDAEPLDCYNPLFESLVVEEELNRLRSSPPPTLKFLRDAEEKLYRKLVEEADMISKLGAGKNGGFQSSVAEEEDWRNGSFIRIIVEKNNHNQNLSHHHSCSSQVLPLTSSIDKKPILD